MAHTNSTTPTEVAKAASASLFSGIDVDRAHVFLTVLFAPLPTQSKIEIRHMHSGGARSEWLASLDRKAVHDALSGINPTERVWYGAALRKAEATNGTADDLAWCGVVWADFDKVSDKAALVKRIKNGAAGVPAPTCIVDSGGGIHAYWRLNHLLDMQDATQVQYLSEVCYGVACVLGSDSTVHDPTRVMGLAGTWNAGNGKTKVYDPPRQVCVIHAEPKNTYAITDLSSLRREVAPQIHADTSQLPKPSPRESGGKYIWSRPLLGIDAELCELVKTGGLGHYTSRSERDYAVISAMIWAGHSDQEIVDTFHDNPIGDRMREKPNAFTREVNKKRAQIEAERQDAALEWEHERAGNDLPLTDVGNAERFILRHGSDVRYVNGLKKWMVWDDTAWRLDTTAEVMSRAKDTVRAIHTQAADESDSDRRSALIKHWLRSEYAPRVEGLVSLARYDRRVCVTANDLDTDPWLLNCLNGTIDLKTGKLLPHDRANLITKVAPVHYDPDATLDLWDRFLRETTDGDDELLRFLQRAIGYSLTGNAGAEVLFFVHGSGATGKSTFLEATKAAMGDYATTMNFGSLVARTHDSGGPRSDILRLKGMRYVTSSEVDDGKRLAEALLKTLTGGEAVVTRGLFREEEMFVPVFKLWLSANHKPEVSDDDDAIWRRILRIPFDHVVPETRRDPVLKATLRDPAVAGPAILAWAVRGCLAWQERGLDTPQVVKSATNAYRTDMDPLHDFWLDFCEFAPDAWVPAQALWNAYLSWTAVVNARAISQQKFGRRVASRGCTAEKERGVRGWRGVKLVDGVRSDTTVWRAPGGLA